jgi:asparagine synthase (glutamine-hydrolysing)
MCGICGVAAIHGALDPVVRSAMPWMTRALEHRGPDGEGFIADDYAQLGHRRLAIIDRAGGAQPMVNEDGNCWVVFNGEIYNHRDLRRRLIARGHRFRTESDTEAIIHAYEEYGPACTERLEGMFAFAVYDRKRRELLLARDRLGKKPLFYAVLDDILHFASEIKAIERSPCWNGALDLSAIEGYLSLGYFLSPATAYRDVREVEPGHWLRLANGRIETRRYWDVEEFDTDHRAEPKVLAELESLLHTCVKDRLESEVPLGAFLSGGVDSGLVVSFMAESAESRVVTASVGFGDPQHNELAAAALTAGHFNTDHHASEVEPQFERVFSTIATAFDQPFADSSAVPTYYVSEAARRSVTVALTGDGGDETFGGYDFRYVPHALEGRARAWVPDAARSLIGWIGARWPRSPRLPRPLRLGTVLENLSTDPAAAYYADLCFLKPAQARSLLGKPANRDPRDSPVFEAVTAPYRRCRSSSPVQRAQYADLKIYLPNDVLVKVDRMSMLHALEVRCPLLDHRLVEFAFRLPTERKLPKLEAKRLLRALAKSRLPAGLSSLPKHGFTAPVGSWIRDRHADLFRQDVLRPSAASSDVIDQSLVRRLFDEHVRREADHSYALWAVWVLERWRQHATRTPRQVAVGA